MSPNLFRSLVAPPTTSGANPTNAVGGPVIPGCDSEFGCCSDGVTPAIGKGSFGCPRKYKLIE